MALAKVIVGAAEDRRSQTQQFGLELFVPLRRGRSANIRGKRLNRVSALVGQQHRRKALIRLPVHKHGEHVVTVMK